MKNLFFVFVLSLLAYHSVVAADLIDQLTNKNISNKQRNLLMEKLKTIEPTAEMSSKLLIAIRDHRSPTEPGINKAWMNDSYSVNERIWYAAENVWHTWFSGANDINKVNILLELLDMKIDDSYVLSELHTGHWNEQAEKPVLEIARNNSKEIYSRKAAYEVLLHRCGNKYFTEILNFIRSVPKNEQLQYFQSLFNIGNSFFKYAPISQQEIIKVGFDILEEHTKDNLQIGYFVAIQLGLFLKIPNEFKPDQNDSKYKDKLGLNDIFFIDTVKNALEWKKKYLK